MRFTINHKLSTLIPRHSSPKLTIYLSQVETWLDKSAFPFWSALHISSKWQKLETLTQTCFPPKNQTQLNIILVRQHFTSYLLCQQARLGSAYVLSDSKNISTMIWHLFTVPKRFCVWISSIGMSFLNSNRRFWVWTEHITSYLLAHKTRF